MISGVCALEDRVKIVLRVCCSFSYLFASDKNKSGSSAAVGGIGGGAHSEKEPQTKASLHNIQLRDGISERKAKERRDQLKKVKGTVPIS